jgi:hypothetical protein
MGVTQTVLERMENDMLKWYAHVAGMEGHRWPKGIMTWSPEGRREWRRPEAKWEKEVERVMERNLTRDDAVNRQLWRLKTCNRWTTGKLIQTDSVTANICTCSSYLFKIYVDFITVWIFYYFRYSRPHVCKQWHDAFAVSRCQCFTWNNPCLENL